MTCIIGLVDTDGTCWMAGDRAVTSGDGEWQETLPIPKIGRWGNLLWGITGFTEHVALLKVLDPPAVLDGHTDLLKWSVTVFGPWWREMTKFYGCDDPERTSSFVFAGHGQVICIGRSGSWVMGKRSYQCQGLCGRAEGVLWARSRIPGAFASTTEGWLRTALQAEADHSPGVAPPFDIINDREEA